MIDAFKTNGSSPPPDISVENHGSIVLVIPQTDAAREWIEANVSRDDGFHPSWPTLVVEPRYVADIVNGVVDAGLRVEVR